MSKDDEKLFGVEQEMLQTALDTIHSPSSTPEILLAEFRNLTEHYAKLLALTKKAFYISDRQGHMLYRHQNEIQNLLDNANQGFLTFGRDLIVDRRYSAECARIFGRRIAGDSILALLAPDSDTDRMLLREKLERIFRDSDVLKKEPFPGQFEIGDKIIRIELKCILQPGMTADRTVVMMILTDITDRLKAEERIQFLSYHDKLTGLFNRAYIEEALPRIEKKENLPISVIMADMNGLKLVNDVFGHQQGDALLAATAKVLGETCRQSDFAARWGGDEFVVILPRADEAVCRRICLRIVEACAEIKYCAIPLSLALGFATKFTNAIGYSELLSIAENRMYNDKLSKSREIRRSITESLEQKLMRSCFESTDHRVRIETLAESFAGYLRLEEQGLDASILHKLAQYHDIGKVAVPSEILGGNRSLTLNEWDIVKSHSEIGYRMAQSIGEVEVADLILALHERWDGMGYPCGLKGDAIPYLSRLFSIVEIYDVITHNRSYKQALDRERALEEIKAGSGTQFDPELARQFIDFMQARDSFDRQE